MKPAEPGSPLSPLGPGKPTIPLGPAGPCRPSTPVEDDRVLVTSMVSVNWISAYVIPLYKGKAIGVCTTFRGVSLLSVVGKVHDRILIKTIREGTDVICEKQCDF